MPITEVEHHSGTFVRGGEKQRTFSSLFEDSSTAAFSNDRKSEALANSEGSKEELVYHATACEEQQLTHQG